MRELDLTEAPQNVVDINSKRDAEDLREADFDDAEDFVYIPENGDGVAGIADSIMIVSGERTLILDRMEAMTLANDIMAANALVEMENEGLIEILDAPKVPLLRSKDGKTLSPIDPLEAELHLILQDLTSHLIRRKLRLTEFLEQEREREENSPKEN